MIYTVCLTTTEMAELLCTSSYIYVTYLLTQLHYLSTHLCNVLYFSEDRASSCFYFCFVFIFSPQIVVHRNAATADEGRHTGAGFRTLDTFNVTFRSADSFAQELVWSVASHNCVSVEAQTFIFD